MKHSILFVDDEIAILQMLSSYFSKNYNIKNAINGKTAQNFIKQNPPDLIIIDWMLPDISGPEVVAWVRANKFYKDIPIIMLTAKSEERDKVKVLNLGADDYMVKPIALLELGARIKALLRRSVDSDETLEYKELTVNVAQKIFYINNKPIKISNKEFKLFKFLIKNPYRIYTREQIIVSIYKENSSFGGEISDRAIDVLISRARKHLLDNNCHLLQTVYGLGYKLAYSE